MSIQNTRPIEGNDDGRNEPQNDDNTTETTPIAPHPLGEAIAEHAPYVRNDARNGGDSR